MSKNLKNLHKPCAKLDKYDNEPYMKNSLLKLRLDDIRSYRRQIEHGAMKVIGIISNNISSLTMSIHVSFQSKMQAGRKPPDDEDEEPVIDVHPSVHINKLRFYARNTPIPKMLKKTEQKIISYSSKRLRDKYPSIVSEYMNEVHSEYDRLMKAFSMNKLLKPLPEDFIPPRDEFQFKRLGRTENYEKYCKNREKIRKNLFIIYPFVK